MKNYNIKLTKEEQEILEGKKGEILQKVNPLIEFFDIINNRIHFFLNIKLLFFK